VSCSSLEKKRGCDTSKVSEKKVKIEKLNHKVENSDAFGGSEKVSDAKNQIILVGSKRTNKPTKKAIKRVAQKEEQKKKPLSS
jgi:hypothetical protein